MFPGGAMGAATMRIQPGATSPNVVAGSTGGNPPDGSGTYCRVCHSASADGSVLITQKFGGSNQTSQKYTNLTGSPAYVDITATTDGRYAWPAIFPNGSYLFGNTGPTTNYGSSAIPGGLDGSNSSLTSAFYSLAGGSLGSAKTAKYHTSGASPIDVTLATSAWGLQGAVPSFSATGAKVAMNFYAGKVCATGTATQCNTAELTAGDHRSLAVMDWNDGTSTLSNFQVLVNELNNPCNTTFHPTQPCHDMWPTFMPQDKGVVFEREIMSNGNVGGGLVDFGGTRSGCDNGGTCSNDGVKGELWWVNLTGASTPTRLNQANGRTSAGTSYLPVGSNAASCNVVGISCSSGGQCCSGNCSNSRCIGSSPRPAGAACSANGDCESNKCQAGACGCVRNADCATTCTLATNRCASDIAYTPPAMGYTPGHNATVEPVLNYEPTMNPTPTLDSGGINPEYYWVVFTSRRQYGNVATVDPWWSDPRHHDLSKTVNPKKLWVAAISANPGTGTDPSFPAFLLPGQEWVSGNSKAYWVQNTCKAGSPTKSAATLCDTNQDCCSGAVCQLDVPVSSPAKRYCVPAGSCMPLNGTCSQNSECCGGLLCSGGKCQNPPAIPAYGSGGTFSRDFDAACTPGFEPRWRFVDYQAVLPTGTSIIFKAQSADTAAGLPAAMPLVSLFTAAPPSTTGWTSAGPTVDSALQAGGGRSRRYLRLQMTLTPSSDQVSTPTLTDWRVAFECFPNE